MRMTPITQKSSGDSIAPPPTNTPSSTPIVSYECVLELSGMDCASCADTVERVAGSISGVEEAKADVMAQRLRLQLTDRASSEQLARALRGAGYPVSKVVRVSDRYEWIGEDAASLSWLDTHGQLLYTVLSGVFWTAGMLSHFVFQLPVAVIIFSVLAVLTGGRYVFPAGLQALRQGALDIHFLMAAAAIGALVIGEYLEGASVLFLYSISEYLEELSMGRARNAVKKLMGLAPEEASLLRDGTEVLVPIEELQIGDLVMVRPGERIPVDATVVRGTSSVNQAAITGESLPVVKERDDEVFAGTLNGDGALELRVLKLAHDTTLARIMHSIEEAQGSRSQTQSFVDRFARIYTPAIVALTLVLAVLPPLLFQGDWDTWIYRALVLLVVSCPCALVIATPVTMVSALGGAARAGILIKGGLHVETAARITSIGIDKTGTLTVGEPTVDRVVVFGETDEHALLQDAAWAERESEHHLGAAIVAHAQAQGIDVGSLRVLETRAHVGLGLETETDDRRLFVGNPRYMKQLGVWTAQAGEALEEGEAQGATVIFVARQRSDEPSPTLQGAIALRDRLRPEAVEALRELRSHGVEEIVMLTGDSPAAARAIAAQLADENVPLSGVHAGLLPEDKVQAVKNMRAQSTGAVAMVGDGVNDAPALAAADLGVAMGQGGTDVALETADVVLVGDDLRRLAQMRRFSQRARSILRWNISIALGLKLIFVVLAATGLSTLWLAVLADTGATLIVVANGLRAMRLPE